MPRTLITRLAGRRVALGKHDPGVGAAPLWAGEFRDDLDRPVYGAPHPGERLVRPVAVGTDIFGVLMHLRRMDEQWWWGR